MLALTLEHHVVRNYFNKSVFLLPQSSVDALEVFSRNSALTDLCVKRGIRSHEPIDMSRGWNLLEEADQERLQGVDPPHQAAFGHDHTASWCWFEVPFGGPWSHY